MPRGARANRRYRPALHQENFPRSNYSADEVEWLKAIGRWRQRRGRWPVGAEVLMVLAGLGYRKQNSGIGG
jgi:hypothetical protein